MTRLIMIANLPVGYEQPFLQDSKGRLNSNKHLRLAKQIEQARTQVYNIYVQSTKFVDIPLNLSDEHQLNLDLR